MTWVKICGMTNLEDALVAVEAGADAVGFVFYEKSPRCVTVEMVREIVEKLPESVEKIGVFVGGDTDPFSVLARAKLTGTQVYFSSEAGVQGRSSTKAMAVDGLPQHARFVLAFSLNAPGVGLEQLERMAVEFGESRKSRPEIPKGIWDTFLLDSGTAGQPGGTGQRFDWNRGRSVINSMRRSGLQVVIAGGLSPGNVSGAIETLHPWGVDVVSGVEASPGKKDPEKVRAFVRAVREMDRKSA